MRVKFSFDLDVWFDSVEIEGKSLEDCKEQLKWLATRDLASLVEESIIKNAEIKNLDTEIVERQVKVKVNNLQFDDFDKEYMDVTTIPDELQLVVTESEDTDLFDTIRDEIDLKIGVFPVSFDYEIIEEEK